MAPLSPPSRVSFVLAALLAAASAAAAVETKTVDALPAGAPSVTPLPAAGLAPLDLSAVGPGAADQPAAVSARSLDLAPAAMDAEAPKGAALSEGAAAEGASASAPSREAGEAGSAGDAGAESARAAAGVLFEKAGGRGEAKVEDWNGFLAGAHYQFEEYAGVSKAPLARLLARTSLRPEQLAGKRNDEVMAAMRSAARVGAGDIIREGAAAAESDGPGSSRVAGAVELLRTAARLTKDEGLAAAAVRLDLLRYASPVETKTAAASLRAEADAPRLSGEVRVPPAMAALLRIPAGTRAIANGAYEARLHPAADVVEFRLLAGDGSGRVAIKQYSTTLGSGAVESDDWGKTWRHLSGDERGQAAQPLAPLALAAPAGARR